MAIWEDNKGRLHDVLLSDEEVAMQYVALCGELAAIVEWCVNNDGETLADNPRLLEYAKRALAKARARYPQAQPHD